MNLESTTGSLFFEARKIEKHVSFAVEPLAASAKDDSMQEKMFQISVKMSNIHFLGHRSLVQEVFCFSNTLLLLPQVYTFPSCVEFYIITFNEVKKL